jgi:peptidoglycan hydrolase CwlO-like protein
MNDTWTIIITLISTLGGWTAIQYFLDWLKTRKSTKTKDTSEAFNNEFTIYKQQIEFLNSQQTHFQNQITERDNKIESLSNKVEELQQTINLLFNENQEIKKKMIDNGCMKFDCVSRVK